MKRSRTYFVASGSTMGCAPLRTIMPISLRRPQTSIPKPVRVVTTLPSGAAPSWSITGRTSPPVQSPPRNQFFSSNITLAPLRAAETAAATPAGPPPTTATSAVAIRGILLEGSFTYPSDGTLASTALHLARASVSFPAAEIVSVAKAAAPSVNAPVFKKFRLSIV